MRSPDVNVGSSRRTHLGGEAEKSARKARMRARAVLMRTATSGLLFVQLWDIKRYKRWTTLSSVRAVQRQVLQTQPCNTFDLSSRTPPRATRGSRHDARDARLIPRHTADMSATTTPRLSRG
eukprot:CAMPEP_0206625862 /NCGR_PEP_ID=MMETSP0325_2-20121206/64980_1 /ASSEMBLY_ACC=CAM_ASM_000347 /TAXON_ID=2866 /ORGANISM="Crypthecodinium cohnii, Strain Seligo" /LENGTH=121 /DNA_ID=CAMNT_0054150111 /DNA_START=139 /DNA_END=504 /DNA_ORIENTATION=-